MALTKIPSSLLDTSGGITLGDSEKALFGAGSDLQIYHDGSHSYIDDQGTGRLYVKASSHITFTNSSGNKVYANFAENGSVGLRYDNDLKIATASTGATVTGDLAVTGDLNITGNVNSASVTDLDVTDKTITLGAGQTEALSGGSGIIIDGSSASILWDETNDTFNINKGLTVGTSNNDLGTTAGNQLTPLTLRSDTANVDSLLFTTKRLSNGNTWTTAAHRIQRKVDSTKMGYIQFGSNTDDLITFGKGNVEYIKIDSSGNVGIGTISPGTDLQIGDGTGSPFITIDKSTTGTSGILLKNAGSNKVKLLSNASEEFELHVNNALAMYVKESGNVGIGTDNPSAKCHLYTSGSEAINLGIQNSQRYWKIETASEKLNIADVSAGGLVRMAFDTSGNVGIGTTTPNQNGGTGTFTWASPLQTIAGSRPTLFLNGSSVISTIRMWPRATDGTSTSVDDWHINAINQGSGGYLSFAPQGGAIAPKGLHIKNTGNVGIGTTNPDTALHVSSTTSGGIKIKQAAQIAYTPSSADNFNQGIAFYNAGSSHAFGIGYGQGGVLKFSYYDNAGTYSEILKLESDGDVKSPGAVTANSFRPGGVNDKWKIRGNSNNAELAFEYSSSAALSDTNIKVKFVSNGNVLLATNSDKTYPTANLDVAADVGVSLQLSSQYNYGPNRDWAFRTNNYGSSNWGGWSLEQSSSQQGTPNIARIGVHANGNVGIGMGGSASSGLTSINPATALHVGGDITVGSADAVGSGGAAAIRFQNDNERARISSIYASGGGGELSFYTDNTSGSLIKRMHISNNGELRFFGPTNLQTGGITSEGNDSLVISGNSANSAGIHMHPSQNAVVPAEGSGRAPADTKDLGRTANSWRNIYLGTGIVQPDDTHTLQHDGGTDRGYKFNLGFIRGSSGSYNHIKTSLPSNTNVMVKFEYDGWIYSGSNMHESVTFYTYHAQSTPHGPTYVDYGSGGGLANVYYSSDNYVVIVIQAHPSYTGGFLYAQCGRSHYTSDIQILATGSNSTTSGVF